MDVTTIPILPCRDLDELLLFYGPLGFVLEFEQTEPDVYAILRLEEAEIHFFGYPGVDPATSIAGCYVRVSDADALYAAWSRLGLPAKGIPRLDAIADKPWGLREFAVVDPAGNLIRVGHILE
jgi:catechol 2,3-dioxygenase-like lactoylglutathione lyase family enzyme